MSIKERLLLRFNNLVLKSHQNYSKIVLKKHLQEGNVKIGEYSYGTPKIVWDKYSSSKIEIGKFCSLANNVTIHNGSNHNINWVSTYPHRIMFNMQGKFSDGHPATKGNVIIGNDVWVGEGSTIFSGVRIGDGAVIAGNSVVVKDVEPYSVYGGAPAQFIKYRFPEDKIKNLLLISWWNWDLNKIKKYVPLLCSENIDEFITKHG